jgi:hypothetical protein
VLRLVELEDGRLLVAGRAAEEVAGDRSEENREVPNAGVYRPTGHLRGDEGEGGPCEGSADDGGPSLPGQVLRIRLNDALGLVCHPV